MKKKVWNKPKLVVLIRSKPEEAVLITCKLEYGFFFLGPEGEQACVRRQPDQGPCNEWFQT